MDFRTANLSNGVSVTNLSLNVYDIDQYIREHLGDRTIKNSTIFTIVYGFLFTLSVLGNGVTVCVLVVGNWKRGWNGIDAYLMNLALTDLIQTCVSLPLEIYKYWNQYPWCLGQFMCSFSALVAEAALYSSILTITAFTFERHCAVVNPLRALRFSSSSRAWKVICVCWIIALSNAAPFAFYHRVNYLTSPDGADIVAASWCAIHYNLNSQLAPLFLYSSIGFYLLPMVVLASLYTHIFLVLREREQAQTALASDDEPTSSMIAESGDLYDAAVTSHERYRKQRYSCATLARLSRQLDPKAFMPSRRIYHILLAIITNFFICYGLFHAQRLIFSWVDWSERDEAVRWTSVNDILFPISGFLYHANPVLDAILYSLMSKKFQDAYKRIFCWCRDERGITRESTSTIRLRITHGSRPGL